MSIITITGGIGCDVEAVAQSVAKKLGLPLFDDQKLQEEGARMGLSSMEHMEYLGEKAPGLFIRQLSYKPDAYLDMMEAVVYEAARGGKGVILGHGSQMLLREFEGTLHVFLYGSPENRSRLLAEQQGMSEDAAAKIIHKSDSEKRGFLHFAFHMDWDDPSLYDLVINRDKLSVEMAAKLIIEAAGAEKVKTGMVNVDECLEKKALVKVVESALLKAHMASRVSIEAQEKDVVKIIGVTNSKQDRDTIIKLIQDIPGVSKVISHIGVNPGSL